MNSVELLGTHIGFACEKPLVELEKHTRFVVSEFIDMSQIDEQGAKRDILI